MFLDPPDVPSERVVVLSSEELNKSIELKTRIAFSELAIIILKMDFEEHDDESNKFQSSTIQLILKAADLPKNASISIDSLNENIASRIEVIKNDPYIIENSGTCLLSALLVSFLNGGVYDSRMRVLLRHLAAFFGIDFDRFAQVRNDSLSTYL